LRQQIFCPLGLAKMPPPPKTVPRERPQEAHTAAQVRAAVKSVDTDKLKKDLQRYEKYSKTLQKVAETGKSDTLLAE